MTRLGVGQEEYFQIIKASVTEIRCIDVWPVPWVQCSHRAEFAVSQNTNDALPQLPIRKVPGNRLQKSTRLCLLCWFEYKRDWVLFQSGKFYCVSTLSVSDRLFSFAYHCYSRIGVSTKSASGSSMRTPNTRERESMALYWIGHFHFEASLPLTLT